MSLYITSSALIWAYCVYKWPIKTGLLTISLPITMIGIVLNTVVKSKTKEN